ncbi:hypothetical protein ABIF93_005617 [Bradyrhizobium japonicum]
MVYRVRELAGRADPFIRRRLPALAERYEAKGWKAPPVSRSARASVATAAHRLAGRGHTQIGRGLRDLSPLVLGGLSSPLT